MKLGIHKKQQTFDHLFNDIPSTDVVY